MGVGESDQIATGDVLDPGFFDSLLIVLKLNEIIKTDRVELKKQN